ncbi:unnamed protein product [Enterobius vermicularis]|uniref:Ground-like domain-containing protein n=1 Tax=Enterobius vermicularis TaxID=51028 RepID=A0A0N4VK49_ENTVE|nr:unnamed protein product [Enterobius vermicularis]
MKVLLLAVCLLPAANAFLFGLGTGCCCGCGIPQPASCGCPVRCPAPAPCPPPICPICQVCPPPPVCPPAPVAVCPQPEPVYYAQPCSQPPCPQQQSSYIYGGAGNSYATVPQTYPQPPQPQYPPQQAPAPQAQYDVGPAPEPQYSLNNANPFIQPDADIPQGVANGQTPQHIIAEVYDRPAEAGNTATQVLTVKAAKVDEAQRKIRNVATADDPKCNSKALKSLIVKNIVAEDAVASKRAIHKAAIEEITDSVVDIICSDAGFTYIVSTAEHCEAQRDKVICFVYKKP